MNYYSKAIDIITDDTCNIRRLLIQIAKMNPSAVVKAHNELPKQLTWLDDVKESIYADRIIEAIKKYRHYTKLGLREAKEAVETLKLDMIDKGELNS